MIAIAPNVDTQRGLIIDVRSGADAEILLNNNNFPEGRRVATTAADGNRRGIIDGAMVTITNHTSPITREINGETWIQVLSWRPSGDLLDFRSSNYTTMGRIALASAILNRTNIDPILIGGLRDYQTEGLRTPYWNLRHTAEGQMARTRTFFQVNDDLSTPYRGTPAPDVFLSEDLLRAILYLNDEFGAIDIHALAGLNHRGGRDDEHVRGLAEDLSIQGVSARRILNFLDGVDDAEGNGLGFVTQRNRHIRRSNIPGFAGPNYEGSAGHVHISIFGRD